MHSLVSVESADLQNPSQVEAKDNDDRSCDLAQQTFIFAQKPSYRSRGGSKQHEHDRESKNERNGVHHDRTHVMTSVLVAQLIDRGARNQRNISWDEWEDAR